MRRKFSFDLPKLKFGPSRQDVQALKQHLDSRSDFDSEPPTPKSVRPPLPSITEAELKAACTWVVANYRPSHIPYIERPGIGVNSQAVQPLDYAAINAAVRQEVQGGAQEAVQWPAVPPGDFRIEQNGSQWPSSDMFRYKPTATSKDLFHQDEFDMMREQRNSILAKADELMANIEETQKILLSPEIRHSRAASRQSGLSLTIPQTERAKATARSDSVNSANSTPRTDITGHADGVSTAPTTAWVTPAAQSKRTSHTQSDTHLPPKVTAVDADWMRQELEKHLKAQEEVSTRGSSPVQDAAGLAETTPTQVAQTPASPQSAQRKPVPRRGTGESAQNFSLRNDSRQGQPHSRNVSHPETVPTSPVNRFIPDRPSTSGRVSGSESKHASRARSITREIQNYIRPGTAQMGRTELDGEPGRSRAGSTRSQVQNFSLPSVDIGSRKVSVEISRPQSRGRSVDSFRSAVSAISSSVGSATKQWRSSMVRRRSQDSERSSEARNSRTTEVNRGRPRMPRHSPPPPPRPQINLNRELPPLPGLDQWKPAEDETPPAMPGAFIDEDENDDKRSEDTEQRPYPRRNDSLVNRRPPALPLDRLSSPPQTVPRVDTRQSVYVDAESGSYYDQPLVPANTRDPAVSPGLSSQSRERHRRSKCIMEAASPEFMKQMSEVSLGQISTEQRPPTRPLHSATQVSAASDKRHSRSVSGTNADAPNFSRKLSSDDYTRMYDSRYTNMLEVTPSRSTGSGNSGEKGTSPVGPAKEKSRSKSKAGGKRHWWQGKPKREETWMDAVVKSGSRSGVLLTDEVAGAPIVRY